MKRFILYFFCAAQLLCSCYETDQNNPLVVGTCMDRIKNQNEEGVDCGGVCDKCEVIAPLVVPCEAQLKENHITINGVDYALTKANYITEQSDFFEITITLAENNQTINIQLYDKLPKVSKVYRLRTWPYIAVGEACIIYESSLATGDSVQG